MAATLREVGDEDPVGGTACLFSGVEAERDLLKTNEPERSASSCPRPNPPPSRTTIASVPRLAAGEEQIEATPARIVDYFAITTHSPATSRPSTPGEGPWRAVLEENLP
ncbi:hypothetical protein FRC04_001094 [Tulasnella sp. 424]|nr:hypothetical protein FRC04_001094 [Tulasnella sp. 424]KAG8969634.1 hypothetical protein FRC05_000999 [Tulasnella sp. 425]